MKKIKVLDCTLRDGGYCNNWIFGEGNIRKIIKALEAANVDMIEYGYLDTRCDSTTGSTRFSSLEQISFGHNDNCLIMINFGEVKLDDIPQNSGKVCGIRVAFHKKDKEEALSFCFELKKRGYQVFVQPMITNSYSMDEFNQLIVQVNLLNPSAFYIVDSFGSMNDKEVLEYVREADKMLDVKIGLGFHGHDNSKMAFSNAMAFINSIEKHDIYVDSTIMGMGRGAGNLGTENLIEYCNKNWQTTYKIDSLLQIIDEIICHFYAEKSWGYSLPFYLAARHNCHPNYAQYFDDKKTLTVMGMDEIFKKISSEKKVSYDKEYAEKVYFDYMTNEAFDLCNEDLWSNKINGKSVLLLAPGKTIIKAVSKIQECIEKESPVVIGVNFDYKEINVDYVFMSNQRRYSEWMENENNDNSKLIVTSNIPTNKYCMKVKYSELLSDSENIRDNAGLMAIRLLRRYQVNRIILAGFDGYQYDEKQNYVDDSMKMETFSDRKNVMNEFMKKELTRLGQLVEIEYLTPSIYQS